MTIAARSHLRVGHPRSSVIACLAATITCATLGTSAAGCGGADVGVSPPPQAAKQFLAAYVRDGRVVRLDQGGDTVSEGQAYGMLLADSLGDSAWVCLTHAEEMLVTVPAAFIASPDGRGIAAFLAGH